MKFYGWLTSGLELAGIFRLVLSIYSQYAVPRYVWRKHTRTAVALWTEERVLDVFLAVSSRWRMAKCFIIWQSVRLLPSTVCTHMLIELCVSVWNCLPDVASTMRRPLLRTVSRGRTINVKPNNTCLTICSYWFICREVCVFGWCLRFPVIWIL
jgi:hypothetical protein